MEIPLLVVSDLEGNIFEIPSLLMAGMSLDTPRVPRPEELIPLPYGSNLFMLPGRAAVGWDPAGGEFVTVEQYRGLQVRAAAAFMAPAYMQFLLPAYKSLPAADRLPLYSYTALGWLGGKFYATGARTDADTRQDLKNFPEKKIALAARNMLRRHPRNRLVRHLVDKCVFCYSCPAARNFVLERWECPVPVSPGCNAACVGCISLQPGETGVTASQERIGFAPTVEEIVEITLPHLENAPRAVISFGQGCEGEPLLQSELIMESIKEIRRRTQRGIINLNTNAGRPEAVQALFKAGLDSIRVSLNSAQGGFYNAYYNPRDYSLEQVTESLKIAREYGKWSSLNYFIFPGFTDHPREMEALSKLIGQTKVNMIQTRNLNIDPDWYISELKLGELDDGAVGMPAWIRHIKEEFPWIKLGYFNPPLEEMRREHFGFGN